MPSILDGLKAFVRHPLASLPARVYSADAVEAAVEALEVAIASAGSGSPGEPGPAGADAPLRDGSAIHEVPAGTLTDATTEFTPGSTWTRDPANRSHDTLKVGDGSRLLTATMDVDLNVTHADNVLGAPVIVTKGDPSPFGVRVNGFDNDGLGTHYLSKQWQSVVCVLQTANPGETAVGPNNTKFERAMRISPPDVAPEGLLQVVDAWGADPNGVGDSLAAVIAMIDEVGYCHFGPGRYRLSATADIPPGTRVTGVGVDVTEIIAEGDIAFDLQRNADGSAGTLDWCRCHVSHLSIRMDRGGIKGEGHEIRIHDVNFYGGKGRANIAQSDDPQHWCIDIVNGNEGAFYNISAGYGGGPFELHSNFMRLWSQDVADKRNVNYGDSKIFEVSAKGSDVIGWVGIEIGSESTHPTFGAFNNMLLSRVQCQAPSPGGIILDPGEGFAELTVPSGSTHSWLGSTAFRFHNIRKSTFICLNGESSETFVRITGFKGGQANNLVDGELVPAVDGSDNPIGYGQGRTSRDNAWIGCQSLNNAVSWSDSNAVGQDAIHPAYTDGTVGWHTVIGGFGIAPRLPNPANGSYDSGLATNKDAPASVNDSFFPAGNIWLSRPGSSNPALAMRLTDDEALYLSSLKQEDGLPWSTTVKYRSPHSTIGIRVGHAQREGHIFMPQGMDMDPPRESRIKIGNGPGFGLSGGLAIGPLQRIELADPVWLTPLDELPPVGGGLPHAMIHASVPAALGIATPATSAQWWTGPGLYANIDDRLDGGEAYVGGWAPLTIRPGFSLAQLQRTGEAYTLSRNDAGKLTTYNRSTLQTITIPAGLVREDESLGNVHRGTLQFRFRAEGEGGLRFVGDTGVTLVGAPVIDGEAYARERGSIVLMDYVRTGSGAAECYVSIIGSPARKRRLVTIGTSGVGNPTTDNYTYTVPRDAAGGILVADFTDPAAVEIRFDGSVLVPVNGPEVAEAYVRNGGSGDVTVAVTAGTTAASGALLEVVPGETIHYVVERTSGTTWVLSNITQSTPSATAGTPAASAVTLDDTGMGITAADVQTAIGEIDGDLAALDAAVAEDIADFEALLEGHDEIAIVAPAAGPELNSTHKSGGVARKIVELTNSSAQTLTLNDNVFPADANAALEYNLFLEGAADVTIDLGASADVITPTVASDIDMVVHDGSAAGSEAFDFDLGGTDFRPAGTGQVAIVTVAITHRTSDAVPITIVWPEAPGAEEGDPTIPYSPMPILTNGEHVATDDTAGHGNPWHAEPTYRSFGIVLGDNDAAQDFTVTISTTADVYAASASLVILNDWQITQPAYLSATKFFELEGDDELRANGEAEPTGLENGIRVTHYHGLDVAAAPADPPIVIDDGGGGASETPIDAAYASVTHASNYWSRGVAAVITSFESEDIIGTVTDGGGTGAKTDIMREFYLHNKVRQAPEAAVTYRGPGPVLKAADNPRAIKLIARSGKRLTAVNA